MNRSILTLLFASLVALFLPQPARLAGQEPRSLTLAVPDEPFSVLSTDIRELRRVDALITQSSRDGTLRLVSSLRDPLLPNRTVERYAQYFEDVPVWSSVIVRDSEQGVPLSIFGDLVRHISLPTTPGISPADVLGRFGQSLGPETRVLSTPQLVVAPLPDGEAWLAYQAVVSGRGDVVRLFMDAHTGAELFRISEIQRQAALVGTGRGVLGDRKKLSVDKLGSTFVAFDRHRPPVIRTWDMRYNLPRFKQLVEANLFSLSAADLAADSDNEWTDPAVVDAHVHVSWTYDYYYKRFGRSGFDGRDGPINIFVNAVSQAGALSLSNEDQNYAVNAFWCGPCLARQGMIYFGNGIPQDRLLSDGRNYTYFAGALDIAAHELTHAVTGATSDLIYRNESGALNEAFSDMMGKSVEFFYRSAGSGVGQADYVLGKDIVRAARPGALNGDRSLANPALYDQPDHWSRYRRLPLSDDNGGVHVNSGIPNHAFYLAIEGGTNRTSGMSVQGVGSANREQIEKVFYRAFTTLLPSSATFSVARIATIQAAADLYGASSPAARAVTQAWDAVGVTNTSSNVPTATGMATLAGTIQAYPAAGYYVVTMPATGRYQAVLDWSDAGVDLDIMISRPNCLSYSCMLTRASSATRRPEAVCADVSAGEQYWVHLENWSTRSTAYQIRQSIYPSQGQCGTLSLLPETVPDGGIDKSNSQRFRYTKRLN